MPPLFRLSRSSNVVVVFGYTKNAQTEKWNSLRAKYAGDGTPLGTTETPLN